jgi:hypothetical protein
MNDQKMTKVIDRLFDRLAATYGRAWDVNLGQAPLADIKTVWMHELGRYENSLRRLAWALDNLPAAVPNAIVFRQLCAQAPDIDAPMLPSPAADPALVAAALAQIPKTFTSNRDPKAWAKRLQAREQAGEKLGMAQKTMYRAALGIQ